MNRLRARRQTTEAACEGLDRAWWFFGATIGTLVPDDMKAIVEDRATNLVARPQ